MPTEFLTDAQELAYGHWPLSSNGAGSYGKASSFLNNLMGLGRIGDGVGRVPPMG
jgi:hypothetical protein